CGGLRLHVSQSAFPPPFGQGAHSPLPPVHVEVVCARAGELSRATAAAVNSQSNNTRLSDLSTDLGAFMEPPPDLLSEAGWAVSPSSRHKLPAQLPGGRLEPAS